MSTSRLILPRQHPTAAEVRAVIEGRFGVTWLGDFNQWTVEAGADHVYLGYDPHFGSHLDRRLSDRGQAAVTDSLGGRPGLALHAQVGTHAPGSADLTDEVTRCVLDRWPGVVYPARRAG